MNREVDRQRRKEAALAAEKKDLAKQAKREKKEARRAAKRRNAQ